MQLMARASLSAGMCEVVQYSMRRSLLATPAYRLAGEEARGVGGRDGAAQIGGVEDAVVQKQAVLLDERGLEHLWAIGIDSVGDAVGPQRCQNVAQLRDIAHR